MTDTITRTPYPNLPEDFWEVMEDTRTAQGLTQNDVCKALNWGATTISQYKNGHQDISYERAKALLDALGIDDYYLPEPDLSGLKIVPENETDQLGEIVDPPNAADLLEERIKEAKELEIEFEVYADEIRQINEFFAEMRDEITSLEDLEGLKKAIKIGAEQLLKEFQSELLGGKQSNDYITYNPIDIPDDQMVEPQFNVEDPEAVVEDNALDRFTYKLSIVTDKLAQTRFAEYSKLKDYIMQDIRMDLLKMANDIEEGWRSIGE